MLRRIDFSGILIPLAAAVALSAASLARAQEAPDAKAVWQVNKSSGEVWLTTSGVQPASLTEQGALKPGDSIYVPRGTVHRNQNLTDKPARSIELNITDKDKPQTEQVTN